MSSSRDTFAAQIQRLLYKLVRSYELCDRVCLTQHDVTASQGYTLLALPPEGTVSMNELSEAMGLAGSTMTRMVDQLVSKRLVQRKPDDEDRRVVRVWLTERGREARRTLEQALQDFFKGALDDIREEERPTILRALERIVQSVEKGLGTYTAE